MLILSSTLRPSISIVSLSRSSTSRVSNLANLEISSKISLRGLRARVSSKTVVKFKAMSELVEDKESIKNDQNIIRLKKTSSEISDNDNVGHSVTFLDVRSEKYAELLSGIRKEQEAVRLPSAGLEELYKNYRDSVLISGHPNTHEIILSNMSVAFDRMLLEVEDPFAFSPYHKAIREPFDYYLFGQNYIRPLIDFRRSFVGNLSVFADMEDKLNQLLCCQRRRLGAKEASFFNLACSGKIDDIFKRGSLAAPFCAPQANAPVVRAPNMGHNVILISNHQSEADPAVISLLLETTNSYISENLTYVAGDRVLTDPLCRPFSMGRNLVCVYSKKHMNDNPELADMKRRSNTRSLKEMALLLRGGSQIIWIAPSGGRDRPDPSTGEWFPAPFDASSVDNIRRLADHSGSPGHIYPLTLTCHDIMPPPLQVEKEIGEKRVISYHGVGLSVAPEMSFNQVAADHENPEEAKSAFSQALYSSVTEHYNSLKAAIHGKQGLSASTSIVVLSQPWL